VNHPNVATIYGVESLDTQQVIVMELVDGETLEERLARGPFLLEEVRRVGSQIAEALDAGRVRRRSTAPKRRRHRSSLPTASGSGSSRRLH